MLFPSLRGYRRSWLRTDLVAGLTVWAVLVPESLAYATIAGVPPVVGLYSAVPALVLYAALGSSRHLVVGPMSATAALSASVVAVFAPADATVFVLITSAVALVTGVLCVLAGLARLGFLASFISEPVLKGFIVGLALIIIVGQVPALLGVEKGTGNFFEKAAAVLSELGDVHWLTAALGLASLAVVLLVKRFAPAVPGSLLVVGLGVAAVLLLRLDESGVDVVGPIEAGLPALGVPAVDRTTWTDLVGPAAGVMLVGFAEALGAAKTYAARAGYDIDPDRELLGMGAANLGSGLAAGMIVNGSLSKTAVNGGAGARSQLSGLTAAALTLVTLLFLTPAFESLPEAVLAAVVIAAVVELVDIRALRRLWGLATPRLRRLYGSAARYDAYAALAAMAGVLVLDTLPGLVIGIVLSMLLLLARASRPHVAVLVRNRDGVWVDAARRAARLAAPSQPAPRADEPRAPAPGPGTVDGVLVVRPEAGLFFANAENVRTIVRDLVASQRPQAVVLDAETVPFVDSAAAEMIVTLHRDLARADATLVVARDIGQVRDVLRGTADADDLPTLYPDVDTAVTAVTASDPPS
ncbi:SulP family inorganic anion transporter [Cellulomonas sp. 179-A 4D5 NHS]|uniref:SulP family inorganic anion transporter n=1 Tax=Cellulomonas sp. 179-A 4D5 NHS TaxID=3142378 RepID=UPI0039A23CE9